MMRARIVVTLTALTTLVLATACGDSSDVPSANDGGALDASMDATSTNDGGGTGDAQPSDAAEAADSHCVYIEAGLTYGCAVGGMGPGDRDDGGGVPPPAGDASPDASDLLFGSYCLDNAQCRDGVCFVFHAKGQVCTRLCANDAICPPTSPGCNTQGVCRVVAGQ
ncbi:MAG: hypothetical protein ABIP89_18900 [Polyangiaceae bacterium]